MPPLSQRVTFVLLIFLGFFSILGISNFLVSKQLKRIEKENLSPPPFSQNLREIEVPKNIKDIEKFLRSSQDEKIEKKEFLSEDKKLKLEYTSDWLEIIPEKAESLPLQESLEKENKRIIFLAEKFTTKSILFFYVEEIFYQKEVKSDEILEEMKKEATKVGDFFDVLKIEKKEKETIFEAKYKRKIDFHLKGKILFSKIDQEKTKVFLVTFVAPEEDWEKVKDEAEKMISLAQLLE